MLSGMRASFTLMATRSRNRARPRPAGADHEPRPVLFHQRFQPRSEAPKTVGSSAPTTGGRRSAAMQRMHRIPAGVDGAAAEGIEAGNQYGARLRPVAAELVSIGSLYSRRHMRWEGNRQSSNVGTTAVPVAVAAASASAAAPSASARSCRADRRRRARRQSAHAAEHPDRRRRGRCSSRGPRRRPPTTDGAVRSTVLADTEDVWKQQFRRAARTTWSPSWCCSAARCAPLAAPAAAMGPFYCPADQKVYIDLSSTKR